MNIANLQRDGIREFAHKSAFQPTPFRNTLFYNIWQAINNSAPPNQFNIISVWDMKGTNWAPAGKNLAGLSLGRTAIIIDQMTQNPYDSSITYNVQDTGTDRLISHEIGHLLGIQGHSTDTNNLMSTAYGTKIDYSQVTIINP